MPSFDIVKKHEPQESFRVASVKGSFGLTSNVVKEHFKGSFELPDEWNIGAIIGNSGTGKTTIAKDLFDDDYITSFEWESDNILDDMPEGVTVEDITTMFNNVGFSSPPSWLKPFDVLSNGEKMRVELARALLEQRDIIVFDEFTSVVDRNIAKIGSYATQKAVRRSGKQFIAVSCHYDIVDWLMPDWVFDTNEMTFEDLSARKKKDPTSTSKFSNARTRTFGKCLLDTTI